MIHNSLSAGDRGPIDFTNDPLLQGRLFLYLDTQLIRLGEPNFHEIPINRPVNKVHNNQRDGFMRQQINKGKTSYSPNSLEGGCPFQGDDAGWWSQFLYKTGLWPKNSEAQRKLSGSFSQAKLFYRSQTKVEQKHIKKAFLFELGKVEDMNVRKRLVGFLNLIDEDLAREVGEGLGKGPQDPPEQMNKSYPADADPNDYDSVVKEPSIEKSEALSLQYRWTLRIEKLPFCVPMVLMRKALKE